MTVAELGQHALAHMEKRVRAASIVQYRRLTDREIDPRLGIRDAAELTRQRSAPGATASSVVE